MRARPKPAPLNLVALDALPAEGAPQTEGTLSGASQDVSPAEVEMRVEPLSTDAARPDASPPEAAPVVGPTKRTSAARERGGVWPWFWASAASLLWLVGLGGFVVGFERGLGAFAFDPFRIAVFALLAAAPLGLLFALAYALRQAGRLRDETERARGLADALVAPTAQAAGGAVALVRELQAEISNATAAADQARRDLAALREALAAESAKLASASAAAVRGAESVTRSLADERAAMGTLGEGLDAQARSAVEAVERQTRLVAQASDLAQAQIREAEAALVARTADLAAAAGEAQDAARLASEDLARQTLKLETAGTGVAEQIRLVEDGLSQQRAALVAAAFSLRSDQEDFSVQAETQRARLAEALSEARTASGELIESSARGAETLRALVDQAAAELRRFSEASDREQVEMEARAREALTRFGRLAAETRDALTEETDRAVTSLSGAAETARRAAAEAAEAAQGRADALGEAVFDAGRRADAAFDARLNDARRLVEQSAALVDEAGARVGGELEGRLASMRSTLAELEAGVAEIDERAKRLPDEARDRVEAVKRAVEEGLASLADAARRAAAETQAVDLAFQERVKRNYDMLSEAVKLMGLVAGERPAAPSPASTRAPAEDAEALLLEDPAPERSSSPSSSAGLRPRLKLTPTATDEEFRTVFGQAAGKNRSLKSTPTAEPAGGGDGWTWKELLNGMADEGGRNGTVDPTATPDELAAHLVEEIRALGVDSAALLPTARIEEAAAALEAGDRDGARQTVRRVAPAAVRRLSRRILTDEMLRARADVFTQRFAQDLAASAGSSASALSGEAGRAFLLIDAAVGDAL